MAKAIMIQGTMSNAGKSLVVAGLCRIFKQDGYKVAPFKSQNMALNSFITKEGLEMGRAQVMQAEACQIEPNILMNPILLKPTTDMGSQVIVNGKVRGNMMAIDYFKYKRELIPEIMDAYQQLAKEYDIIVIEGAGSPAEINLKSEDIVNMGMAKMAKAPVLLVGDIDRGGVFAQLVGTILLLEPEEQGMIKGLLINKFRGDRVILNPGLVMLEEKCNKEVLGVIPYMNVDIDDEDSLSQRLDKKDVTASIDIAIMKLPRISNFTDFNVLETIPGFSIRYVNKPEELGVPDMIILPGTKSTMDDLKWMRQNGLETLIKKAAESGILIFAICGGYQMLGKTLSDPHGVEGFGEMKGMELIPMDTIFTKEKRRTRVVGTVETIIGDYEELSGSIIEGYEIHMGNSIPSCKIQHFASIVSENQQENKEDNRTTEYATMDGIVKQNICGTYIHGIFDSQSMLTALQRLLYKKKNLTQEAIAQITYKDYREQQYDTLARVMRESLDMERIYQILQEGIV